MADRKIPTDVFTHLRQGFIRDEAHEMLWHHEPGRVLQPTASYGEVLGWLWRTAPTDAISLVADLLSRLHHGDELTDESIDAENIVEGLALCLYEVHGTRLDGLIDCIRAQVPALLASNAP